jgi:hypothetical protein
MESSAASALSWSPTGDSEALVDSKFMPDTARLWIHDLSTRKSHPVAETASTIVDVGPWSSAGTRLFFSSNSREPSSVIPRCFTSNTSAVASLGLVDGHSSVRDVSGCGRFALINQRWARAVERIWLKDLHTR